MANSTVTLTASFLLLRQITIRKIPLYYFIIKEIVIVETAEIWNQSLQWVLEGTAQLSGLRLSIPPLLQLKHPLPRLLDVSMAQSSQQLLDLSLKTAAPQESPSGQAITSHQGCLGPGPSPH